jgi:polysaccharide export outer membrane protein
LNCVVTLTELKSSECAMKPRESALNVALYLFLSIFILSTTLAQAQDEAYRIGVRDVLSLTIFAGGEEQQSVQLTVDQQGRINVPFVGAVKAEGLTVSELRTSIVGPLSSDYFVNPDVNLFVKEYHSLQYYITGAVRTPGLYNTNTKLTLLTLIAKAGGVTENRGNEVYILRDSTQKIQEDQNVESLMAKAKTEGIDLDKLLNKGEMSHNRVLRSGDVVYIPIKLKRI